MIFKKRESVVLAVGFENLESICGFFFFNFLNNLSW